MKWTQVRHVKVCVEVLKNWPFAFCRPGLSFQLLVVISSSTVKVFTNRQVSS